MELQAPIRQRKSITGRPFSDEARNQHWIALFRAGRTTVEIGAAYGVAGGSVARMLRNYGIKRSEGGKEVAAKLRREAQQAAELAAYFESLDCSPTEFDSTEEFKAGLRAFGAQRKRAQERAIGWDLTFGQWWRIWLASGQWAHRGRSHADSAVMARRGDEGAYRVGNVYITTLAVNFSESHAVRGHRAPLFSMHAPSLLNQTFEAA